jgi:predicted house-cleaning noncanonical NTP pyrophosphatase (MazG superfamily)
LLMEGTTRNCLDVINRLLDEISAIIYSSLAKARIPSLSEVSQYVMEYIKSHGSCIDINLPDNLYLAFLEKELERIGNMLLDKAMEALSKHMEVIKYDVHNLLSAILTNYALHETKVTATFYELIKKYGKRVLEGDEFTIAVLRTMEEAVFAAIVRFLAVTRLIASMSSKELEATARSLAELVDSFMREENNTIIVAAYYIKGLLG